MILSLVISSEQYLMIFKSKKLKVSNLICIIVLS